MKILLRPVRVHDEVSGDTEAVGLGHPDTFFQRADVHLLVEGPKAVVGGRLEAEEQVEVARDRPPLGQESGMLHHRVEPCLHQYPVLLDAAADELPRELQTARARGEEQIVDHEHVVSDLGEVVGHVPDVAQAERATVVFPDGAECAAVRAAARGLHCPERHLVHAQVVGLLRRNQLPRGQRHLVEAHSLPRGGRRRLVPAGCAGEPDPRQGGRQRPAREDLAQLGHRELAIADGDGIHFRYQQGSRERRGRVAAHQGEDFRRPAPDLAGHADRSRNVDRVSAGDAHHARSKAPEQPPERGPAPQVRDPHLVPLLHQGACQVFEPQGFHPEERSESEALVR